MPTRLARRKLAETSGLPAQARSDHYAHYRRPASPTLRLEIVVLAFQAALLGCLDSSQPVAEFRVAIAPAQPSLGDGDTLRLSATVTGLGDSRYENPDVHWSSSAPAIVEVDGSGLVTGRSLGSALVRASFAEASADVEVDVVPPFRVFLASPITTLLIGDTTRLVATVLGARSDTIRDPQVLWTSENPDIASVDQGALVRARSPGVVHITATLDGATSEVVMSVTLILIKPTALRLLEGDTARLRAIVVDQLGDTLPNTAVTWSTSDREVFRLDSTGFGRALKPGFTIVTATTSSEATGVAVQVDTAVLVGAGDIAICPSAGAAATAVLLDKTPGVVFTLGDNAYPDGSTAAYSNCYAPTWGRHRSRTRPAPGNHDYETPGASGYFNYFGSIAGDPLKGYYSYDIGAWHIIVLNNMVSYGPTSAQVAWLKGDLAAHPQLCTAAYWHYPLFSSGIYAVSATRSLWNELYAAGADVVMSGHDHHYERFAPQRPDGVLDLEKGIREFVVGTGGHSHQPTTTIVANSEVRNSDTFGVLKLTLHPSSYDWKFIPTAGRTFTDSGSGTCH